MTGGGGRLCLDDLYYCGRQCIIEGDSRADVFDDSGETDNTDTDQLAEHHNRDHTSISDIGP